MTGPLARSLFPLLLPVLVLCPPLGLHWIHPSPHRTLAQTESGEEKEFMHIHNRIYTYVCVEFHKNVYHCLTINGEKIKINLPTKFLDYYLNGSSIWCFF